MIKHSTRSMTFTARTKMFVAERSQLTEGGRRPLDGRIYDDACDAGFVLVSNRTQMEVRFAHKEDVRDRDGDVTVSIYEAIPEDVRKDPVARSGMTVHVLNT
jgi:hypothetical protein